MEALEYRPVGRELSVSTTVDAPADFTIAHLPGYLKSTFKGHDRGPIELGMELPGGVVVGKHVRITLGSRPDGGVDVAWEPLEGGAFPEFRGTFHAIAGPDAICELTMSGSYVPPGGQAGRAFDALLGYRVARVSLGGLLARIAASVAADYRIRMEM